MLSSATFFPFSPFSLSARMHHLQTIFTVIFWSHLRHDYKWTYVVWNLQIERKYANKQKSLGSSCKTFWRGLQLQVPRANAHWGRRSSTRKGSTPCKNRVTDEYSRKIPVVSAAVPAKPCYDSLPLGFWFTYHRSAGGRNRLEFWEYSGWIVACTALSLSALSFHCP